MKPTLILFASMSLMMVGCPSTENEPASSDSGTSAKAKPTACVYKTHHRRACSPNYPRSFNEDYTETKCLDTTSCRLSEPRSHTVGGCVTAEEDFDEQLVEGTCEQLGLGHVCDATERNDRYLARWECAETTCAGALGACREANSCIARVLCEEDCSKPNAGISYEKCAAECTREVGAETEEALNGVRTCLDDSLCQTLCSRTDLSL